MALSVESLMPNVPLGSISSDWILYERDETGLSYPAHEGVLMVMDLRTKLPEVARANMESSMFSVLNKPALFMTEKQVDGCTLGSAWVFADGLPGVESSGGGGGSRGGGNIVKARFLSYECGDHNAASFLTYEVDSRTVIFSLVSECDGSHNLVSHGVIDKPSSKFMLAATSLDQRSCNWCTLNTEVCNCLGPETSARFDSWKQHRTKIIHSDRGNDTPAHFTNAYTRSWLEGGWKVEFGSTPPFVLEVICHTSGTVFEDAALCVFQGEMMKNNSPFTGKQLMWDEQQGAMQEEGEPLLLSFSSEGGDEGDPGWSSLSSSVFSTGGTMMGTSDGSVVCSPRDAATAREAQLRCNFCALTFRRRYDVKRHIAAVHEKRKDFVCHVCGRGFSQTGHLNEHIRVKHSGDKAHQCSQCSKTFGAKSKLERHIRTVHHNERNYVCSICNKSYKEKSYLKSHEERRHQQVVPVYSGGPL